MPRHDYDGDNMVYEYWKSRLPTQLQRAYELALAGFQGLNANVDCGAISLDDCKRVYYAIYNDHAELYYLSSAMSCTQFRAGPFDRGRCMIKAEFLFTNRDIVRRNTEMERICESLRRRMPAGSDEKKERMLCDYLIENARYEIDNRYNQNAGTLLVDHKGQCSGISKAFKYLCDQMNIQCIYVTGDLEDRSDHSREAHAWNIVRVDGRFYHVDVTSMLSANKSRRKPYHYVDYNFSDTKINADHFWDWSTTPRCNDIFTDNSDPSVRRLPAVSAMFQLRGHLMRMDMKGKFKIVFDCNIRMEADKLLQQILDLVVSILKQRHISKSISINMVGPEVTITLS